MPGKAKYLMIASMDIDPQHEDLFNEVYDREHVPNLSKVPGVLSVTRYKREPLTMNIGGECKSIEIPNEPLYTAIYELESPEVLTSAAWDKAVEQGRWPTQVRPHTKNRRHVLLKVMGPEK
ncbi:MAG TPA: hypothetical protein VE131_02075 [Terriglobales bacterium]|nr:hypothetical protein [Terriglobales bacterium]